MGEHLASLLDITDESVSSGVEHVRLNDAANVGECVHAASSLFEGPVLNASPEIGCSHHLSVKGLHSHHKNGALVVVDGRTCPVNGRIRSDGLLTASILCRASSGGSRHRTKLDGSTVIGRRSTGLNRHHPRFDGITVPGR